MTTDCTVHFARYREIRRAIWNLGFVPFPDLLTWESERAFHDAMMLLFRAMVLLPLGAGDIERGETEADSRFRVELPSPRATLLIDKILRVFLDESGGGQQSWLEKAAMNCLLSHSLTGTLWESKTVRK